MKIQSYNIEQVASTDLKKYKSSTETLTVKRLGTNGEMETKNKDIKSGSMQNSDFANISEEAQKMLDSLHNNTDNGMKKIVIPVKEFEIVIPPEEEEKLRLLEEIFGKLIGRKVKFYRAKHFKFSSHSLTITVSGDKQQESTDAKSAFIHTKTEMYAESEAMAFMSKGNVETQDGRQIEFSVELLMARAFSTQKTIQQAGGDLELIDPLVINFGSTTLQLSNRKIMFDLNADGIDDYISFVGKGAGFIVHDKNNDGQVNDGTEVFGAKTGDGFAELQEHDSDGNGWIDENDPIFKELSIWTLGENDEPKLVALGKQGVGAIYLGNVSSQFHLTDENNKIDGVIQKSGVFLNEDGTAGTMHHIDLAI